jgi:hypothetical protein
LRTTSPKGRGRRSSRSYGGERRRTYSDGTTVNPNNDQKVNFIGVSGYYHF